MSKALLLIMALVLSPVLGAQIDHAAEDDTPRVALVPGTVVNIMVYGGRDSAVGVIGDYEFTVMVKEASERGLTFDWSMTHPASMSGSRTIRKRDLELSHKLSAYYGHGEAGAVARGYTSLLVSKEVFHEIKAGKRSAFRGDGGLEASTYIEKVGSEALPLLVNDRDVKVRAIKARTSNGFTFWILDNPDTPLVLKADREHKEFVASLSVPEPGQTVAERIKRGDEVTTYAIIFAFASAEIKPESKPVLDGIGKLLREDPSVRVRIEGHTDSIGGQESNLMLSKKRAENVRDYLVRNFGIVTERLLAIGYGEERPVADNATPEGRARNRRVVFRSF